MGVVH